jgi:hypothetical protein
MVERGTGRFAASTTGGFSSTRGTGDRTSIARDRERSNPRISATLLIWYICGASCLGEEEEGLRTMVLKLEPLSARSAENW